MMLRAFYRRCRAWINPHEWQRRLLGLTFSQEPLTRRGLILIQIDGLSYPDFQNAKKRYMPFLSRLMRRENYHLWPLYPGVPSNTPSFQGEFFFGVHQCVPAFQFFDRAEKKTYLMYQKSSAGEVEKRLLEQDKGLIADGSAYGSILAGGAAESHICASTAAWSTIWKDWNPYALLITFILNPFSFLRSLVLCLMELVLAFVDFVRGSLKGQHIVHEWLFILTRVLSTILIRDIMTGHARMDIYRGLPVIFVNYFGYDEQAHRRGPSTRFAYWSLHGIDDAIKQIWWTAMRAKRHYDVWIYSDHGQEKVAPFSKIAGLTIHKAVREVYEETHPEACQGPWCPPAGNKTWGDTILGQYGRKEEGKTEEMKDPVVTTLGPIAQIYFPESVADEGKRIFAKRMLAKYPAIPLVAIPLANGDVEFETTQGTYQLPQDAEKLFGTDHPYRDQVARDLVVLLKHEKRGDLMLFGWREGAAAISFSDENGAHAGLGPRETQAFALLPEDAPLEKVPGSWLNIPEFRQAALIARGRVKRPRRARQVSDEDKTELRVMSYNVHSCTGLDGKLSVDRIARVIAKADPDVVALQELDAGRRIKGEDQASAIARELEMHFHFHPVCGRELQCFGNAILSRYPMKLIRAEHLPVLVSTPSAFFEPRGILWVEIDFEGHPVQILNTHLSIWGPELRRQVKKLVSHPLLNGHLKGADVVLCGDLNMSPGSKFYRQLTQYFKEPVFPHGRRARNTWTSQWPIRQLDHILLRGNLEAKVIRIPRTRLEIKASDHLPLVADITIQTPVANEGLAAASQADKTFP